MKRLVLAMNSRLERVERALRAIADESQGRIRDAIMRNLMPEPTKVEDDDDEGEDIGPDFEG